MAKKSQLPILKAIEELYEKEHKKITPLYPINKKTGKSELARRHHCRLEVLSLGWQ